MSTTTTIPTTSITDPTLADLVARGTERNPHLAARLQKAAALVEARKVHHVGGSQWLVAASTSAGADDAYDVDTVARVCTCADAAYRRQVHQGWCSHVLAAKLVERWQAEAPLHLAYVAI